MGGCWGWVGAAAWEERVTPDLRGAGDGAYLGWWRVHAPAQVINLHRT